MEFVSLALQKISFFNRNAADGKLLSAQKVISTYLWCRVTCGVYLLSLNSCFCVVYLRLPLLQPVRGFGLGSGVSELRIGE